MALVMVRSVNARLREWPMFTACSVAGAKNCACDAIVQLTTEDHIDMRRNATFIIFGCSWVGAGQYLLFNRLYPRLFGTGQDARTITLLTLVDNFVHIPCAYLPLFYLTRELATSRNTIRQKIDNALASWRKNFCEDVTAQAAIFVPAQAFNFAVNPPHLRVPFLVGFGVIWVSFLSYFRGDRDADARD